jgi:hypothetical protein
MAGVRRAIPRMIQGARLTITYATKRGELIEESLEFRQGPEQLGVADHRPDEDNLDRPVAEHLIREAEIAALCV